MGKVKKERIRRMKREGMHEIKNKYRSRAVRKRKKGLVLTPKKKRTVLKIGASIASLVILALGIFSVASMFMKDVAPNVVSDDFVTVSYEAPTDGTLPTDHTALENIGYLNDRFKKQTNWYLEVHGTTSTPVGPQSVNTFKQYSDGILIMADVTSSGLVKAARQFCYVGDEVMWRTGSSYTGESYEAMQTIRWNEGEPYAHMTIESFKQKNGLPGTEMTVYIINEETLLSADEVVDNGDGTYSQTYYLDPARDKAPAHYVNQMKFTGGLTDLPKFEYITVTYTFDGEWNLLVAEVNEAYEATMGITVNCSSSFRSEYEYNTPKAESDAYENYFKQYVGKGIDDEGPQTVDSMNCLTSAFLTKPVTFEMTLDVNGKGTKGIISLDASKLDIGAIMKEGGVDIAAALGNIGLKAKFGEVSVCLDGATAYLSVRDLKVKMSVSEFLALIQNKENVALAAEIQTEDGAAEEASIFVIDDPATDEPNDGFSFTVGESARMLAQLDLTSLGIDLVIPLSFDFRLDENNNAELVKADVNVSYAGVEASIGLKESTQTIADLTDAQKAEYIDLLPYADALYRGFKDGNLAIGFEYAANSVAIDGAFDLSLGGEIAVSGNVGVSYQGARKQIFVAYAGDKVYLDLDGIKLSANVSDAIALVTQFVGGETEAQNAEEGASVIDTVLSAIFEKDLAAFVSVAEADDALTVAINGTELLQLFGVDFALGNANLALTKDGTVTASVLGATLSVGAGKGADVGSFEDSEYVEIMPYAETLAQIFTAGTLTAKLDFAYEGVTLGGTVNVSLSPVAVSGDLTVSYKSLKKNLNLVYADGGIYLTVDGLKVFASVDDVAALVTALMPAENGGRETGSTLAKVLALDLGALVKVSETESEAGNTLALAVKGTELLDALNIGFALGDVTLSVGAEKITASVFGVDVTLTAGGTVTALSEEQKAAYTDLQPVLNAAPDILNKKAVSLGGSVAITIDKTNVKLNINRGVFSFANGIYLYLDATLALSDTEIDLTVAVDTTSVKVSLGGIGAELAYNELSSLGDAVVALYKDVRKTLNPVSENELLPEANTIKELLSVLVALFGDKKTEAAPANGGDADGAAEPSTQPNTGFSLDSLLSGLTLKNSDKENGLLAIEVMGVTLDVLGGTDGSLLGVSLGYEKDGVKIGGALSAAIFDGEIPTLEETDLLDTHDFVELLDYLAAAVRTLAENNLNISLSGTIGSDNAEKYPDGVKYNLSGTVNLYSGKATTVHLNLDKKALWVDSEAYLHASVGLEAATANDKSVYIELFVLDCDESGNQDGVLDAYVSVSFFKPTDEKYNPLTVYAPANELMPVLSSALGLLGVDQKIVTDYVIAPWISDAETVAQLKGFGSSIKDMLTGMGILGGTSAQSEKAAMNLANLIEAIEVGDKQFEIALSSAELFGKEGAPLTVTLGKEQGASGTRLTAVSLANIKNVSVAVAIGYDEGEKTAPTFKGSLKLDGIASLLQTIARSTTHRKTGDVISGEQQKHEYVLNENFYIDGSIRLDVNAIGIVNASLNIKLVACSVTIDEDGIWGVNVRFEYDALKKLGISVINGNTQVDLTGKDNTVYIKRVQTSDADGKALTKSLTTYRAMPLKNFVNDLIGQMGFLFNLGSDIANLLNGIDMGGSSGGSGTAETVDLGTTVSQYLSSIAYAKSASGENWTVTLNGAGISGGVLGDIVVAFGADAQGMIRTLTANTSLSTTGISMTIDAGFTYHNPCGVMDAGVTDITSDIAAQLTSGMSHKLNIVDWASTKFIEGEFTTVEYVLKGEVIATQNIVLSSGNDGFAKGEVYGALVYPDLTPYQTIEGYKAEWSSDYQVGDPLPESRQIFAKYNPCTYQVTFILDGEELTQTYEYGSQFELPFREDEIQRVIYFVDGAGNEYRTADDMKKIVADATLTAVYEQIEYTVVFDLGEEQSEQKAHYGDAVVYPENPVRDGYTFAGWDSDIATVSGNITVTAQWTANVYNITFVSSYEIDGYEWTAGDNGFTASFEYAYGTAVALPQGVRVNVGDQIFLLQGFCAGGVCYFDKLPSVTEDTVFTAQWQEPGFSIVFVARDGSTSELSYHAGETIPANAIPAIDAIDGYSSTWKDASGKTVDGGYTVTGETTFTIVDTANVYTVSVIGSQPYDGFASVGGQYVKTYSYVYDGAAVTLGKLSDVKGYWFKGYYTGANGAGEAVETLDKLLEDTAVYVWWQDNTVTVRVLSDVNFVGATGFDPASNAYYKEYTFNDNYDVDGVIAPQLNGYQTLALWREAAGGYELVKNVRELDGADIWALWIKNLNVRITEFSGNSTFTIRGVVLEKSGDVYGEKSIEIAKAVKITSTTTGHYAIFSTDGKNSDTLEFNKEFTIKEDGTFGKSGMTSLYALGWGGAAYGGVVAKKTFSYQLADGSTGSITTSKEMYVSRRTCSVTLTGSNKAGTAFVTKTYDSIYFEDYPYDDFDSVIYLDEFIRDLVAREEEAIDFKDMTGYSKNELPHTAITGDTTFNLYTVNSYKVTLQSAQGIEGWTQSGDAYVYETEMNYGAVLAFYDEDGLLASYKVGLTGNVFTVPAIAESYAWGNTEVTVDGLLWTAKRNVDLVTYNSVVAFDYGAETGLTVKSQEITDGYTLIAPTATGYTFLGWYRVENGSWTQVSALSPTAGGEKLSVTLQALWKKTDLSVNKPTGSRGGGTSSKYNYTVNVTITSVELVGAFASDASVTLKTTYTYNFDSKMIETTDSGSYYGESSKWLSGKYSDLTVTVKQSYVAADGTELFICTASNSNSFYWLGKMQ